MYNILKEAPSKKVNIGSESIAYRERDGKGEVLVMLHGNLSSSIHFDVLFEKLGGDLRLIAPDFRGSGDSSYNNRFNSLKDLALDFVKLVDALKIDRFYVLGWSTGGGVALSMAGELKDRIKGVFLIESVGATGYPIYKKDEKFQPILSDLLTTKEDIEKDPVQVLPLVKAINEKDRDFMKFIWDQTIYTTNKPIDERYELYIDDMLNQKNLIDIDYSLVMYNITKDEVNNIKGDNSISNISAPVLVFQGDNDLVVPSSMADSICTNLKNGCKRVQGPWGHSPLVDDLDRLVKEIEDFVK